MEALKTISRFLLKIWIKMRWYAVILAIFAVIFLWAGEYTIFDRLKYQNELSNKLAEIEMYKKQIEECDKTIENLEKDNETLEHYAREVYYMKKHNEDIFLVEEE